MTKLSMSEEEMLKRKYTRPYEKRIAELEDKLANLEYLLEGKDNEIDELKKENKNLAQNLEDTEICENGWKNRVKELEAQNEKMRQCGNCGNGTIGNCEYCKRKPNQTRIDTSDYWRLKEIKRK